MKRLALIRKEPNWRHRHKLIENRHPGIGTPLEPFFAECKTALELAKVTEGPAVNMAKEMLAAIGLRLAENIQAGKWWHIFTLGKAVRAWSDARQRPASDRDKIRDAWVQLCGMFPNERIEPRHVIKNLQPPLKLDKENLRRIVQRIGKEMGYLPGRTSNTPATKTKKKLH
jgi:hypothetical protein